MGYRMMFVAGLAVGYVLGAKAGRERYDQIMKAGHQVADHPAVQKATQTVTTKTTEAKAPDFAKSASAQGSKIVTSAKQKAADHMPSKLGGSGKVTAQDDVSADGSLIYPADDSEAVR